MRFQILCSNSYMLLNFIVICALRLFSQFILPARCVCPRQKLPHPVAALWDSSPVPLQWQSSVSGLQITVCPSSPVLSHIPKTKDVK